MLTHTRSPPLAVTAMVTLENENPSVLRQYNTDWVHFEALA